MRRQGLWAVVVICAAGAACSESDPDPAPIESRPVSTVEATGPYEHTLDVDWVAFSEAEMYRSATAIVRGRVIEQRYGQHRTYPFDTANNRELTPEEAGDEYAELPLTISVLEVEENLDGSRVARGARIEVVQLGGFYSDGSYVVPNDQPLLTRGEQAIVYVKPAGMVPRGTLERASMYSIIGGQQGLLPIRDGVAAPLEKTAFARHARRALTDVEHEIRELAERVRRGDVPAELEVKSAECDMSEGGE